MRSRCCGIALALAALCASSVSQAGGALLEQATDGQKRDASDAFKKAKAAFSEGRLDEALNGFRASYEIVASPNARLMIALTLRELGQKAEAYELLGDVAVEANEAAKRDPRYQVAADTAIKERGQVRAEIGMLSVAGLELATEDAVLAVNGRAIPRDRWHEPIAVEAGELRVELTSQETRTVSVAAGGDAHVDFSAATSKPEPLVVRDEDLLSSDPGPNKLLIAHIVGGAGALGLISFAIFGGLALSKFDSLEDECPNRRCPAELSEDADTGQAFQVVANVGLVVGIVGVAVAGGFLAWHFLDPPPTGPTGGKDETADTAPSASLTFGAGSLVVDGRF